MTDVRDYYDSIADRYDAVYTDAASVAEDRFVAKRLSRYRPESVLDVGCGTGWVLDHVPEWRDAFYLGFDISQAMVTEANAKWGTLSHQNTGRRRFAVADGNSRWPVADESVDMVVSTFGSPSHLDPYLTLYETLRVLRKGGSAVLIPHALGVDKRPHYLDDVAYLGAVPWASEDVRYAAGSLCRSLRIAGFRRPGRPVWWPVAMGGRRAPDKFAFLLIEVEK